VNAAEPVMAGEEVSRLYAQSARSLRRLIGDRMRLPDDVLDDACQVAWLRYLSHHRRVARPAVLSWLLRTAAHEACRTAGRHEHEVPLDSLRVAGSDEEADADGWLGRDPTDEMVDHVARLEALRRLTPRQRRMMWLQASGLSYAEIAQATGDSPRTVERQLGRARQRLGASAVTVP
jgi:RNA polymerase sigma factor (sigma-70 family)